MSVLSIDKEKYLRLEKSYNERKDAKEISFEGNIFSISYVKYLLGYLKAIYGEE